MKKFTAAMGMLLFFAMPVSALDITAPTVSSDLMPADTGNFADGLRELLLKAIGYLRPDLAEASKVCISVIAVVLLVCVVGALRGEKIAAAELAGTVGISVILLQGTNSLIHLGAQTVEQLSEYGKLLLPVMTAAMAAEGAVTASAALYTGTLAFAVLLTTMLSKLLIPMVYVYLALAVVNGALGEDILKQMRDFVKWLMTWCLKTLLTVFITYISITGAVSGTTDAAALKMTKMTISGMVPVVGGILSDASEAVLVSAGVVKNSAGIYGILAILALFLEPFLQIGSHYLMLKATGSVCCVFGSKRLSGVISDFGSAMGLLLGMTGAFCLLLLISTVCFLRGVG